MKRATVIGTLVATAMVAICALGTASASAAFFTTLCKKEVQFCFKADRLPAGSTLHTDGVPGWGSFTIQNTAAEDYQLQCDENALDLTSTQVKGYPLPAVFSGSINASECKMNFYNGASCSDASIGATSAEISTEGEHGYGYGTATIWGMTMSFTCDWEFLGFKSSSTCTYAAEGPVEMEISSTVAAISGVPVTTTSGPLWFCGEDSEFLELDVLNHRPGNHQTYLSYYA